MFFSSDFIRFDVFLVQVQCSVYVHPVTGHGRAVKHNFKIRFHVVFVYFKLVFTRESWYSKREGTSVLGKGYGSGRLSAKRRGQ